MIDFQSHIKSIFYKLLGSSERSRKAQKNIRYALLIKGISICISFLLVPITLGYLKPIEYGVWMTLSSILVWINYFDIGLGNGLRNKLAEAIAKGNLELGRIYVSTTIFLLSIIIAVLIASIIVINLFINWHALLNIDPASLPHLNSIISILFILCGIQFVVKVIGTVYVAHQIPVVNDLLGCLGQVLSLVYIFILSKTTNNDFNKVVIGFTLAPVIVYLIAFPYTFLVRYKYLRPSLKYVRFKYVSQLGGLGIQFFIIQMVCLVLFSSSNIIITNIFGPEAVTKYNIAYKYINISLMVFTIILTPYWTAVTDAYHRHDFEWIRNSYSQLNRIWYVFTIIIIVQTLISKFILKIWINNEVEIPFSLFLSIGFFISILMRSNLYATFFNGLGKLKVQLIIAVGECVVYIISLIILRPIFGLNSVPLSLALSMLIGTCIYGIKFKQLIYSL